MGYFAGNSIGVFGSLLGGYPYGITQHPQQLAAMQQEQAFNPFEFQRQQARGMQAMQPSFEQRLCHNLGVIPGGEPPRKKVELKVIETVEIRPEQNVKLLKAGKGI